MINKKKIIVLPNDLTSSFFVNEIPYLKEYFDDVKIICYNKPSLDAEKIIQTYNLECSFLSLHNFNFRNLISLLKWFLSSQVREEVIHQFSLSKKGIKKICYILLYGIYNVLTSEYLEQEILKTSTGSPIVLYSYWLSRTAYSIINVKEKHPNYLIKAISRAHRYDLYEEENELNYLPFRKPILKGLDNIYPISNDGYIYLLDKYSVFFTNTNLKSKLCVSRLGTFNKKDIKKIVREKKDIVIASCSFVVNVKRLDLIIGAVHYMQMKGMKIKWIHIGDGPLMDSIKAMADRELQNGSFQFLGRVNNDSILETYQKSDVDYFINLSDSEGIPVSIMEAMSVGIPIIARYVGGTREIVTNNNGCLLEGEEINLTIYEYIRNREVQIKRYKESSDSARETWNSYYSAHKNYEQFYNLIMR